MGNLFSVFGSFYYNNSSINTPTAIDHICGPTTTGNGSGRKRTASGHFSETQPICAKRFKLNTLHYVYQKLFVEGLNSDVFVHALGHTWKLHRLYLEQCDYFRALFHGNWSDSGNNEYNLAIEDENICFTGLNNVFASLYNNEIEIDEQHIAGVCGAASMLSLNSVLDKCNLHLAEYVRQKDKMLICLRLADRYGFEERMTEALDFLKFTLCQFCTDPEFLRGLHPNWLIKLLAGEFICVRENELDLYLAIRNWIFLRECPDGQMSDEQAQRQLFNSPKFEWRKYWQVLRHIRVAHLCNLASTLERISADGLIPKEMIGRVVGVQWETLLRSEEMPIQGGNNANGGMDEVEDATFYANCFRLGRTGVSAYSRTSWRWLGYFFGVDLLVSFDYGFLRLTRNCTVAPTQHQISIKHVESMKLHYRCIVCIGDGTVLLDTKKQSKMFNLDRSIELGAFKLPSKSEPICVHLFYLPFPPSSIHHSPQRQWDQLGSMEEQQSPPEFQ